MAESQVSEVALKYMVEDDSVKQTNRYKAYPEYKYSGVEWLGEIPSGWDLIRLKHVVNLEGNKTSSNKEKYVGLENIESKTGRYLKTEDVIPEGVSNTFNQDNVLFGKLRPYLAKSWLATFSGICSSEFLVLDSQLVHPKFLNYFTLTEGFIEAVNSSTYGTKMPRASWDFIGLLHVPIMDYGLSEHIANFLDIETAKIDTLIEKQQRLIELLTEKRQAVISHAVTKGLNPDLPMKESGVEWLGEVPKHWEILKLKHLIKALESGCSVNAADIPANSNEVGVLKTSCVYTRTFRVEENKTVILEDLSRVKCPVREGAIIISRMNTPDLVGASAIVKEDISNIYLPDRLWQTIFDDAYELEPEFLAHFMTIKGFRNQISLAAEGASSSMQNIAKEDYLAINCALPPISEQKQIVDSINSNIAKFELLIEKANQAIQLMQERRTALISAAVTGKIDVRDWVKPE